MKKSNIADQDDLKKTSRRGSAAESLRVASQVSADAFGGLAEAVASAFRGFRQELEKGHASAGELSNTFLEAVLAGQASFYSEVAATANRLFETVKTRNAAIRKDVFDMPPIDYELLAVLVAKEMRKLDSAGQLNLESAGIVEAP